MSNKEDRYLHAVIRLEGDRDCWQQRAENGLKEVHQLKAEIEQLQVEVAHWCDEAQSEIDFDKSYEVAFHNVCIAAGLDTGMGLGVLEEELSSIAKAAAEKAADEIERLRAIVEQHPKTVDGKVITWGDRLYAVDPENSFADWFVVRDFEPPYPGDTEGWLILPVDSIDGSFFASMCYSTQEAVEEGGD